MIIQYGLMLNRSECGHPYLVKEQSLNYSYDSLNSPDAVVNMLNDCFHLSSMAEEFTYLIVMDAAGHPTGVLELSHGTVCETPVGLRELFIRVLLCGGASFVIAHNHPSGQTNPSKEDREVCLRIKDGADLLGIKMVDFLILGYDCYYSFSQKNLL